MLILLADNAIEKDKVAPCGMRQPSAPQFRSRVSRIGLNMFTNYIFPGSCILLTSITST